MTGHFGDRLFEARDACGAPACVGVDPHPGLLPDALAAELGDGPSAWRTFIEGLLDACAGTVPLVKVQVAFFEAMGPEGMTLYADTLAAARDRGLLSIGDVKRGDIGSTSAAYAAAHLGPNAPFPADAVTLHPWLGTDGVEPFLKACAETGGGAFILVRTSNPSGNEFQDPETGGLAIRVAEAVDRWGADLVGDAGWSSVGAVVGATRPEEIPVLRSAMPRAPMLLPGVGAQGGDTGALGAAFDDAGHGGIITASRSVMKAGTQGGAEWREALVEAVAAFARDAGVALTA